MNFIPLDLIKSLSLNDGWIRSVSCTFRHKFMIGDRVISKYGGLYMKIVGIYPKLILCQWNDPLNGNHILRKYFDIEDIVKD